MQVSSHAYPAPFGEIILIRIVNDHGAAVTLSSLGAGIIAVEVPDRNGHIANVALSYENPADYMADGPCMGKIPGRYANRIAAGNLTVDGKRYKLAVNCGPNHLHGGPTGFQNHLWETELLSNGVRFTFRSPDGDENYPGAVTAVAEYRWSNDNELSLDLSATSDAPTVINLTNHTYWNLDGADAGSALDHELTIRASEWLPTDDSLVPLPDAPAPVADTPMDFRTPKKVGRDIHADFPALKYGKGYDNCWVLPVDPKRPSLMRDAVTLHSERSGRTLIVDTDQPGVQVYTGNWLSGSPRNVSGRSYDDYDGIAIEAQGLPDAPNRPDFPSQRLDPGHPYRRTIIYRFPNPNLQIPK